MAKEATFTTGELAARFGVPGWRIRRAVDALGDAVPRAGLYRLVPQSLLGRLAKELRKRGARQHWST